MDFLILKPLLLIEKSLRQNKQQKIIWVNRLRAKIQTDSCSVLWSMNILYEYSEDLECYG